MDNGLTYKQGLKHGLPVCVAYLAVSFTFGLIAVKDGLPAWLATVISGTNLTSAGQFAGINMIVTAAGYFEIALAVFIINSRYMLMSLSISQQLDKSVGTIKRLIMSIFVTDEIFALASVQKDRLNFKYFLGLATTPYLGWVIGTLLGGLVNTLLPQNLQNAMGIALYCMFIAIIIPPAKKSRAIILCIVTATGFSCMMEFVPVLNTVSFGFRVIIASVLAALFTALIYPVKDDGTGSLDNKNPVDTAELPLLTPEIDKTEEVNKP